MRIGRKPIGIELLTQCSVARLNVTAFHVGSVFGSQKWAYALSSGVCFDRKRARITVWNVRIQWLLGAESVMVNRVVFRGAK